jgi:hypothetical protein
VSTKRSFIQYRDSADSPRQWCRSPRGFGADRTSTPLSVAWLLADCFAALAVKEFKSLGIHAELKPLISANRVSGRNSSDEVTTVA